jgi:hypothetical protein
MASPAADVEDQMVTGITSVKRQWREVDVTKILLQGDRLSVKALLLFGTSVET